MSSSRWVRPKPPVPIIPHLIGNPPLPGTARSQTCKWAIGAKNDVEEARLEMKRLALELKAIQEQYDTSALRYERLRAPNEATLRRHRRQAVTPHKASDKTTKEECYICVETRSVDEFAKDGHLEKHAVCKPCLTTYLRVQIMDLGSTTIACPHASCKTFLEYDDVSKHADLNVFKRFDELLCRRAFEAEPNFRWCTNPNCQAGQIVSNPNKEQFFRCVSCQSYSCFRCKSPGHRDKTCEQVQQQSLFKKEEVASASWLKANTRTCVCGRYCEKADGCDHITCPRGKGGCGAEWCWLCGASYANIREVGNTAHDKTCKHYA